MSKFHKYDVMNQTNGTVLLEVIWIDYDRYGKVNHINRQEILCNTREEAHQVALKMRADADHALHHPDNMNSIRV